MYLKKIKSILLFILMSFLIIGSSCNNTSTSGPSQGSNTPNSITYLTCVITPHSNCDGIASNYNNLTSTEVDVMYCDAYGQITGYQTTQTPTPDMNQGGVFDINLPNDGYVFISVRQQFKCDQCCSSINTPHHCTTNGYPVFKGESKIINCNIPHGVETILMAFQFCQCPC
jgi:hypothetical protein